MPAFAKARMFLRNLFSSRQVESDLDREVRSHLEMLTNENMRGGMSQKDAQRAARMELGGIELVKEQVREQRLGNWLHSVYSDSQFALRQLRKSPGLTTVAIVILALGIGANTAIFSLLDPLLLRKLPVRSPDELVWVNSTGTLGPAEVSELQTFNVYREKARAFSGILAFSHPAPYYVHQNGERTLAMGELVSRNYFNVLGVRPFTGRLFDETDLHSPTPIVLSFDFWRREFHADANALGQIVTIGDQADATRTGSLPLHSYAILGIAPPDFLGVEVGEAPDFYLPLGATDLPTQDYWQTQGVSMLARLKPGVSVPQAEADLNPVLQQAGQTSEIPEIELRENYSRVLLLPAARGLSAARAKFSLPARVLMGVVAFVLLIACANIANLLLARGVARRREITLRIALGAGRWRVIRQLLTEHALLALVGTVAGVAIGQWTSRVLLLSLSNAQSPLMLPLGLNWRMLTFAGLLLVIAVLVSGLAPALSATHGELAEELKAQGSGSQNSADRSRLGQLVIVGQVALATVLLASAGLLLRSLFNLETFNPGFQRDKVLIATLDGYSANRNRSQIAEFYGQLLERLKQLPGVHSASFSGFTPVSGKEVGVNVIVDGYTLRPGEVANERFVGVSPGYFETMGIPLLAGRDFARQDVHPDSLSYQSTSVAIINRSMAHRFFHGSDPIGKHFQFVEGQHRLEIVGVVADSKYNDLREGATDFFYIPGTHGDLEIRSDVPAETLANPLREIVHSLDSSVNVASVVTLRAKVDQSLHTERLIATLCGIFSILAVLLTCVGIYGLLAFQVQRRTSEIGLRIALGATGRNVFRTVLSQGIRWTFLGLMLGILGALAAGSLLASLLFEVRNVDPATFVVISIVMVGAAVLACYIPARRASRVDPMVALRYE
jgi:predicted permease